ncbi:hypothetical protein RGUI_0115 [Rhodovulum sp. P5]|nr:hypothetical protein RGUI_0115 [Rhodovulum sp. P5]
MSRQIENILTLSARLAEHEGITHWGVSRRLSGKGDLLDRLEKGGDLRTRTAEHMLERLSALWPDDLEWPASIPRPAPVPPRHRRWRDDWIFRILR